MRDAISTRAGAVVQAWHCMSSLHGSCPRMTMRTSGSGVRLKVVKTSSAGGNIFFFVRSRLTCRASSAKYDFENSLSRAARHDASAKLARSNSTSEPAAGFGALAATAAGAAAASSRGRFTRNRSMPSRVARMVRHDASDVSPTPRPLSVSFERYLKLTTRAEPARAKTQA